MLATVYLLQINTNILSWYFIESQTQLIDHLPAHSTASPSCTIQKLSDLFDFDLAASRKQSVDLLRSSC